MDRYWHARRDVLWPLVAVLVLFGTFSVARASRCDVEARGVEAPSRSAADAGFATTGSSPCSLQQIVLRSSRFVGQTGSLDSGGLRCTGAPTNCNANAS